MKKKICILMVCVMSFALSCVISGCDSNDNNTSGVQEIQEYSDLIGMKTEDAVAILGNNYLGEFIDGCEGYYYEDLGLFFASGTEIDQIIATNDLKIKDGLDASMTYPQIKQIVDYAEEPEYQDEYDEWGTYSINFNYKGLAYYYGWWDDPYTTDYSIVFVNNYGFK